MGHARYRNFCLFVHIGIPIMYWKYKCLFYLLLYFKFSLYDQSSKLARMTVRNMGNHKMKPLLILKYDKETRNKETKKIC